MVYMYIRKDPVFYIHEGCVQQSYINVIYCHYIQGMNSYSQVSH